jgi:N6-L-threonylcarbamoyladenine synthase
MNSTYILGIESSCDETAAAVVRSGEEVISNIVASQIATHQPYGGVVPELASREHLRAIVPVVRQALADAERTYDSIDALAVTQGPGLAGALLWESVMPKLSHSRWRSRSSRSIISKGTFMRFC